MSCIEADRLGKMAQYTADDPAWESRYAPGSFGYHEAMHVAGLAVDFVGDHLLDHGAVIRDPIAYELASEAQNAAMKLYQHLASLHFSRPNPPEAP